MSELNINTNYDNVIEPKQQRSDDRKLMLIGISTSLIITLITGITVVLYKTHHLQIIERPHKVKIKAVETN